MATRWRYTPGRDQLPGRRGLGRGPCTREAPGPRGCPSPQACAVLTEERAAVEADGGFAGHLGPVEDGIIELVGEGEGLRARAGGGSR